MKRAIQPSSFSVKGENVFISSDDWYEDDHPYVKLRPDLFVDADKHPDISRVEQATAAPGEKRNVVKA